MGGGAAVDPGKNMGIAGLILSIIGCTSLIGLIVSILAYRKSKAAGYKNTIALIGIVIGILALIGLIITGIVLGVSASAVAAQCAELGPGTHQVDGVTYTCS